MQSDELLEGTVLLEESMLPIEKIEKRYGSVAFNVEYNSSWEQAMTFPARKPFIFSVMVATIKTWTADLLVQLIEVGRTTPWYFDWFRSMAFAAFGCLYLGIFQWYIYQDLFSWLFPRATIFANEPPQMMLQDKEGQIELVGQVLVDNFILMPFMYFPVFYIIKELVQGHQSVSSRFPAGLNRYWGNLLMDNLARMSVWIPADFVIFALPAFLRMPLMHAVSLLWTMFLSFLRGSIKKANVDEDVTNET